MVSATKRRGVVNRSGFSIMVYMAGDDESLAKLRMSLREHRSVEHTQITYELENDTFHDTKLQQVRVDFRRDVTGADLTRFLNFIESLNELLGIQPAP